MSYWPWWLGGTALAAVSVGFWLACGRLLGVSGSVARVLDGPERDRAPDDGSALEAELLAMTRAEFGDDAVAAAAEAPAPSASASPSSASLPWSAHLALLVAIVVGGAVAGATRGGWHLRAVADGLGADFTRLVGGGFGGIGALFAGGLLVGFGTAMSGGCTSGHGLCGTSRLQRGSLAATAAFFGAGALVALALERLR